MLMRTRPVRSVRRRAMGPKTEELARTLLARLGRPGQSARYGLTNLPRTYAPAAARAGLSGMIPALDARAQQVSSHEAGDAEFLENQEDAALLGPPGTGKSHVAKALALLATEVATGDR